MSATLRAYYMLMKPGIIRGNLLTVIGGFLLASHGSISASRFIGVVIGSSLIIGSGCVFNNYIDRNIDKKMKRTKKRALADGTISVRAALTFGTVIGLLGTVSLIVLTNWLTLMVGVIGFVFYVVFYSIWKRKGPVGTLVGSVSGAVPPVAGYTAASGHFDTTALILFAILTAWQMPHFYAIALFRSKDYAAADIPVLPVVKGAEQTKRMMIYYIIAFGIITSLLTAIGTTGYIYLVVMAITSIAWLIIALRGFKTLNTDKWARSVFGFSLVTILIFSLMISVDNLLA